MRAIIKNLISAIKPFDEIESAHIADTLNWIDSSSEIFRIKKPDKPPKHLVTYFVLVDQDRGKLLLLDHIQSGLWLPGGGHVEIDEHPKETVEREIQEELNLKAIFISDTPVFLTQTETVNINAGHIDISLWYILNGNSEIDLNYDKNEFKGYKWFLFAELNESGIYKFDPHMQRFMQKLNLYIGY